MKYIFLSILLVSQIFATSVEFIKEMKYETVFEKALEKAKSEDKILMMVATSQSCPWCRKMERQTLKKEEINSLVQKSFVPLSVSQDEKNYPEKYLVQVVPTTYFINSKDGSVLKKVLGYKNKQDFKLILEELSK